MLPSRLIEVVPIIFLLSCIISLGAKASSNELVIMQTSGFSVSRVCYIFAKFAIIASFIISLMQETFITDMRHYAENYKIGKLSNNNTIVTKSGFWTKSKNQYIYIDKLNKRKLQNIKIFYIENGELAKLVEAKSAKIVTAKILGKNVTTTLFAKEKNTKTFSKFEDLNINLQIENLQIDSSDAKNMTILQQARYIFDETNYLSKQSHIFYFTSNVLRPISMIIMVLIAVPLITGPLRKSSIGNRIIAGTVVGIAYYFITTILGPVSMVLNINPVFAVLVPMLLFGTIAFYYVRKYA
jgi:lipopolysaccharide export system permease protein